MIEKREETNITNTKTQNAFAFALFGFLFCFAFCFRFFFGRNFLQQNAGRRECHKCQDKKHQKQNTAVRIRIFQKQMHHVVHPIAFLRADMRAASTLALALALALRHLFGISAFFSFLDRVSTVPVPPPFLKERKERKCGV